MLMAVLRLEPPLTVRKVMVEAGLKSTHTAYKHLLRLREEGLVTWEDGKAATIRPLVMVVW